MAMRRLLEEEAAPAPAPATEDALIEGAAVMRAAMEAGFELTPEELALLELETAAPAPAPGASALMSPQLVLACCGMHDYSSSIELLWLAYFWLCYC